MPLRRISNDYCTPIALIHESSPNKQHSSSRFFASTSVASIFPFEWRSFFSGKLISQENSCGRSRSYRLCDSFTQEMQISELVESFGWKFEDPANGCVERWECYKREREMKRVSTQVSRLNYTRMYKCEIEFKSKAFSPSAPVCCTNDRFFVDIFFIRDNLSMKVTN